jgi:subtilase family serine protease
VETPIRRLVALASHFGAASALAAVLGSSAVPAGASPANPYVVAAPRIRGGHDLGRAPRSLPVRLAVRLAYRNEAELDALIAAQGDPASPLYRHYLTAGQFDHAFGAAQPDAARAVAFLRSAGFSVTQRYGIGTFDVTGPVEAVERTFGTEIHTVVVDGILGARYTNVRPATVPAELRRYGAIVDGFSDALIGISGTRRGHPVGGVPLALGNFPTGPDGGSGPYALANRHAYDYPVQHGFDGTGRTVATTLDGTISDTDIAGYLAGFHITRTGPPTTTTLVNLGCGGTGCVDTGIATFNAEQIVGLAPGVSLILYEIPSADTADIEAAENQAVAAGTADAFYVATIFCDNTEPFAHMEERIAMQAVSRGITMIANTFDVTFECPTSVSTPSSAPHFLGVGSTSPAEDNSSAITSEPGFGASGGGVSTEFALPRYQLGVLGVQNGGRNTPDIATAARVNDTEFSYYAGGNWSGGTVGGVNLLFNSAPIAALVAEANQKNAGRLGFVNTRLYNRFVHVGYNGPRPDFHDITTGPCIGPSGSPPCPAVGYDLVTGIGSVDGFNLTPFL